jgi:hypothetical protein
LSKQTGQFTEDDSTKKGGRRKRRGPWEVWVDISEERKRSLWLCYPHKMRDYATKELAETAAEKWRRDKIWDIVEVRYNETT